MKSSLAIDDIINFSLSRNLNIACLVDIDTMYGTIEFYNKCIKNNIKPVVGLQIGNIVLIAKNNDGLKQLYKISLTKQLANYTDCFYIDLNNTDLPVKENYYLYDDNVIIRALQAIKNGETLAIQPEITKNLKMLEEEEAMKLFSTEQINNLNKMLEQVDISIPQGNAINFVKFDENSNSKELLEKLCINGLTRKIKVDNHIYQERMNMELVVIDKMGFNDYFLVIQDFVNYAKNKGIYIGPGRGSAAGSLISYLLNITEVDPIANDLIFERFLNVDRKTMPDIDVDIEDDIRYEVIDYIFNKYGFDKTAHIITFQRMKAKMALTDVGRILNIDLKIIKNITSLFGIQYETKILAAANSNKEIKE
jgi:DNA polymerase-3 subunit alpha